MRSLLLIFSVAFTIGTTSSAFGQSQSDFEKALQQNRYPTASNEAICYAKTDAPSTFDLSRLCGSAVVPTSTSGGYSGSSYRYLSTGGTSNGVCNVPSDIARDGSRCGGRAANERLGKDNGGNYNPSYSGSSGGEVYVRPYTRSDGTSVRGHYRSK